MALLFSKTIALTFVKFHMKHDQGLRIIKLGQVEYLRWPLLLKIAKTIKSTSSPEPLGIIGYKFVWNISGNLVFKIIRIKKIHSRIRSQ